MKEQILFVDDDPNILEAYQRKLQRALKVQTAEGPMAGLRELKDKGPFAVVIADMNMPLMNGIEFLQKAAEVAPHTVRIMLTGNADIKVAMQAVNDGNVFRFLTKPCPSKVMGDSLIAGIAQYRLVTAEKELLEGTLNGSVELLAEILSWVNPDVSTKTVQLRSLAMAIASKLESANAWEIKLAATLSQIGVMALPSDVFTKLRVGETLGEQEQETLASVPAIGEQLLKQIPRLENVARIVLYQGKHYDGNGLPIDAVAGKEIPMGARILKVANDFIELRPSNKSHLQALKQMRNREGWYDPLVLAAAATVAKSQWGRSGPGKAVPYALKELKAGLILAADITTLEGRKLVAAGAEITGALLIRLNKFADVKGVKEPIEVFIDSSEAEPSAAQVAADTAGA